ncbi:MAG: hypothetical protein U9Q80_04645 [Bacillota bacterium]|nr:hypothetical protein [Bacillota bacterium]
MFKKIKVVTFISMVVLLLVKLIAVFKYIFKYSDLYKYRNFIMSIYSDTYASNFVAAIYLDYRLYDSIFEATILFVVATGIIFMVRKDTEMIDKISFHIFKSVKR